MSISQPHFAIAEACVSHILYNKIIPQLSQSQFGGIRKRGPEDVTCIIRLLHDYSLSIKIALLLFMADIKKAFDCVDPNLLAIILYKCYKIRGKLLRFIISLLHGNVLIVKNGNLFSAPYKAKKSTPQGSQMAGLLFNIYCDETIKKIEKTRLGIQYQIEQGNLSNLQMFNENDNIDEIQKLIKNDLNLKIKELNAFKLSLIITILLFCDDTTIITDCPIKLQQIINVKIYALKCKGMLLHPDKCQLIYFGKKFLSFKQQNY